VPGPPLFRSEDAENASSLLADVKERAEHVMVVDLERNDLGVVSEPGSIVVDPLYRVLTTPYCHQLVSCVRGMLRDEVTVGELLDACFPCGSVTGAPKRSAMRIASELETGARGSYCGSILVAMPGVLDSSVLIRTLEGHGELEARWGAGAGITSESDPAFEWLETLLKASPAIGDLAPSVALRETMRVQAGEVPLLDYHLARLAMGGCGASVLARVRSRVASLMEAPSRIEAGRLSVTVTTDGSVAAGTSEERSSLSVAGGPRLASVAIDRCPELPQRAAKPASRRFWDVAHRRARALGADQAALVSDDGRLIDGSTANIWIVRSGRLVTPLAPPAVAGVAREVVLDLSQALGLGVDEREVLAGELDSADEVFLSNAYGGVVAVRGRGGQITERVRSAFEMELARRAGASAR